MALYDSRRKSNSATDLALVEATFENQGSIPSASFSSHARRVAAGVGHRGTL